VTTPEFEAFLARLYVEEAFRERFLADPLGTARAAGLSEAECEALEKIDREGLVLAARSFARKREKKDR
jgi:hypothetical protein